MHLVVLLVGQELRAYSRAMQPQQAVTVGLLCLLVAMQGLRAHGRSLQALQQQPTRQQPTQQQLSTAQPVLQRQSMELLQTL